VPQAIVGYRGVDGDRQATRKHHGRVWQAICLWSTEVIDTLAAEGHPVAPGFAGENFTLSGIDWATLRPGARLEIGGRDGVVLETTAWATPCKTLNDVFTNRDFRRIDVLRDPGASRLYAKVLRDGVVRAGDPVRVH
jgi:MOSC domain-containing protein YiiM